LHPAAGVTPLVIVPPRLAVRLAVRTLLDVAGIPAAEETAIRSSAEHVRIAVRAVAHDVSISRSTDAQISRALARSSALSFATTGVTR
jgi:hypothetical protein